MEELFKKKLMDLRNPKAPLSFAESLLGECSWLKKESSDIEVSKNHSAVIQNFSHSYFKLDPKQIDINFKNKNNEKVRVLFVTEKFRKWDEASVDLRSGFINELILAFPLKTAELFERMIQAMKLDNDEVMIVPFLNSDESDGSEDVFRVAEFFRPEVIITLGSSATSGILKSNDRLAVIHGQFFSRKFSDDSVFQIIPLFHPSIIETNQNMKKTAWSDMQKIMKYLKKLP